MSMITTTMGTEKERRKEHELCFDARPKLYEAWTLHGFAILWIDCGVKISPRNYFGGTGEHLYDVPFPLVQCLFD